MGTPKHLMGVWEQKRNQKFAKKRNEREWNG
jgi:hypothetical protein